MDNSTSKLLDETVRFIERYNTDLTFQKQLNQVLDNPQISLRRVMYRGRPLKLYTDIISKTLYYKYREYQQKIKASPPEAKTLLKICYNAQDLANLAKAKSNLNQFFSPQEQEEISRIEQLPKEQKPKEFKKMLEKQNQLPPPQSQNPTVEKILQQDDATAMLLGEDRMPAIPHSPIIKIGENKDGEEDIETGGEEEPHIIPSQQNNLPKLRIPVKIETFIARYTQPSKVVSFLATPLKLVRQIVGIGGDLTSKNAYRVIKAGSDTVSKIKNNLPKPRIPVKIETFIARYTQPSRVVSFLATPLKLARQALGIGGNLASRGTSAAARAGGNTASKIGSGVLDAGERMLRGQTKKAAGRAAAKLAATGAKLLFTTPVGWAILGIIIFIFLFIFIIIVQQGVSTDDNNYTAGDISQCKFTRGQENPPSAQYKSPLLLSYFQEASQLSGVPAVILAAITRVESPSSTHKTNADLISTECPESGDGALGIMQIIPQFSPRTDAFCRDCVALGASYLGKTVDQLTRDDYCNPRTSIFLGAGFILKKLAYNKIGDGTKWDPAWTNNKDIIYKLASSFYGCLNYPSCQSGPYSYGEDLWSGIQGCKINNLITNPALASCPVPNGKITCPSFGPLEPWGGFWEDCAIDSTGNGGHCNSIYQSRVGICLNRTSGGNLIRTAKSIDVTGENRAGEPVYLPDINGKKLTWHYNGSISAGSGFGAMSLFQSEKTPEGIWSIHFVHVNYDSPKLTEGQALQSGELAGTMYDLGAGQIHVHITVGLNVGDTISDTKDYSPNWKFADRDLNMCTNITKETGLLQGIVDAASKITGLLAIGSENLNNVKIDEPGIYYWCTYLIVDSYNQAGNMDLTRATHGGVLNMKAFFNNTTGYQLLSPSTTVEQLGPGNVIFFEGGGGRHVSLVESVEIDENGNGVIHTLESNNVQTEDVVFVVNHQTTKAQTTARIYNITGFGQVTKQL